MRAPAVLVEGVEGDKPVDRAAEASVLPIDAPPPEGSPGRFELDAREIEAALGVHDKRPSESIQPEDRIGARNEVDIRDGRLRNKIPVDRLPEPVIEAHAVQIHRQADGTAGQGRGQETAVGEVVLPGVTLVAVDVDGAEVAVERVRDAESVLVP